MFNNTSIFRNTRFHLPCGVIILPFTVWLETAEGGDVIVLQGEFSATFALVDFALGKSLIPVCAVTERVAYEERQGEIVHRKYVFEHIRFRQYQYYKKLR